MGVIVYFVAVGAEPKPLPMLSKWSTIPHILNPADLKKEKRKKESPAILI